MTEAVEGGFEVYYEVRGEKHFTVRSSLSLTYLFSVSPYLKKFWFPSDGY